jgi:hypothetical protein
MPQRLVNGMTVITPHPEQITNLSEPACLYERQAASLIFD